MTVTTMVTLVVPYVALLAFVVGALRREREHLRPHESWAVRITRGTSLALFVGMALWGGWLTLGFLAPEVLAHVTRTPALHLVTEGVVLLGMWWVALSIWVIFLRAGAVSLATPRGVVRALAALSLVGYVGTALGSALLLRWATAWYTAVVVPYVHSVLFLDPEPEAFGTLPALIRAHVWFGMALLALWPYTGWGRDVRLAFRRVVRPFRRHR